MAFWTGRSLDERLPTDSLAGRVERIESLSRRADSLSESEAGLEVRRLVSELKAESPLPVKTAAVRCLAKLPSPAVVQALQEALRDSAPEVRAEACRSLSAINSPQALNVLAETLASEQNVDCRLEAVRGLGRFRDPLATQALGSALDDRDPAVQYLAMQSLRQSTGENLGEDVRRWKEFTDDSATMYARRNAQPTR